MLLNLEKSRATKIVMIAAIAFFCLVGTIALNRYLTFYYTYDQGIFNQVFWNNLHGNWFESSLASGISSKVTKSGQLPTIDTSYLGHHFSLALLIWLPVYALFPDPTTLIFIQVSLITGAGLVLYLLAREYVEPAIAVWIVISFYCANAVIGPTLSNFHNICQLPILIFTALLGIEKRIWWLFAIASSLILLVREEAGLTLFGIGIYLVASRRYPRLGLAICVLTFGYIVAVTNFIMPLFTDDIGSRLLVDNFGQYVDNSAKTSTLDLILAMLTKPWLVIKELFVPIGKTINYLLGQWLPLAFIPAVAPTAWIIGIFPLLVPLLSKDTFVLGINVRFAMTVVPALFYGTILWWGGQSWKNIASETENYQPRKLGKKFRSFWIFCLSLTLLFTITSNPHRSLYFLIPDSIDPWIHVSLPQQWQRSQEIRSVLAKIPPDASVSATNQIIPYLSSRRTILRYPSDRIATETKEVIKVDYLAADLWRLQKYQIAFRNDREALQRIVLFVDRATRDKEYGIIDFKNSVILLQKGAKSNSEAMTAWLKLRRELNSLMPQVSRETVF
ncbi:MAG: DUF2079 domain-containing protein [Prochloraceae cyanobacterium]|nr:DUF2079 domain-containing protein [Prochloraceae cyanobacterium]